MIGICGNIAPDTVNIPRPEQVGNNRSRGSVLSFHVLDVRYINFLKPEVHRRGDVPASDLGLWPVVEAAHDGEADGEAGGPAQQDDHLGGRGVVPVLAVQDRGRHREEPGQLNL